MRRNTWLQHICGLALGCVVATAFTLCAVPAPVRAEESDAIEIIPVEQEVIDEQELELQLEPTQVVVQDAPKSTWNAPATEDLIGSYIEHRFAEELGEEQSDDIDVQTQSCKTFLSKKGLEQYERLKKMVADVAAGKRTSTIFEIDIAATCGKLWWSAQELGVDSIMDGNNISAKAVDALIKVTGLDLDALLEAIAFERPYDLYWYDGYGSCTPFSAMEDKTGSKIGFAEPTFKIYMPVSDNYAAGEYEVDPACGQRVSTAVAKAKSIAAEGKNLSAFDRLALFKGRIRELASYDWQAAKGNAQTNDPWQMVSVFDGDKNTNVVCEGYSKAFKYLCDLAAIPGVECRRIDGTLTVAGSGGNHMWNIVNMDDGRNYIADVTNCSTGTKVVDDPLFLAACTNGSVASGYKINANNTTYHFAYFPETTAFYTNSELTLSTTPYAANPLTAKAASTSVSTKYNKTKNITTKANVSVSNARGTVTYANASTNATAKRFVVNKSTGTVTIPKKTAAGTYTVAIKATAAGNANYKPGTKTVSYTIKVQKAANGLKVKTSKQTVKFAKVSKKKQVVKPLKVTGAIGTVTYKKAAKGSSKCLSINKKSGKVTVSKGTKKGTYKIKVQVKAAGNKNYKAATKTVTCKVEVN